LIHHAPSRAEKFERAHVGRLQDRAQRALGRLRVLADELAQGGLATAATEVEQPEAGRLRRRLDGRPVEAPRSESHRASGRAHELTPDDHPFRSRFGSLKKRRSLPWAIIF